MPWWGWVVLVGVLLLGALVVLGWLSWRVVRAGFAVARTGGDAAALLEEALEEALDERSDRPFVPPGAVAGGERAQASTRGESTEVRRSSFDTASAKSSSSS